MRLPLAVLLLLCLSPGALALGGDLNNDGYVNVQDLLSVVQHIGRGKPYSAASDLNGDGSVNLFDLTRVSRDWGRDYWLAAPSRSSLGPSGQLAAGVGSATLQVTTNASANCSYSTTAGQPFSSMTPFTSTGGTSHTSSVAVQDGQSYAYHVKCRDAGGLTSRNDATIAFTIASAVGSILFSDGFESGNLNGAQGGNWYVTTSAAVSSELARTGSHSLRFFYPGSATVTADSWSEIRGMLSNTPADEVWMEWYLYVPANYEHRVADGIANNKFWILGYEDKLHGGWSEPGGWTVRMETNPGATNLSRSRLVYGTETSGASSENAAGTGPRMDQYDGVITSADLGTWVRYGVHLKLASSIAASDGEVHFYKNGQRVITNEGFPIGGTSFSNPIDSFELMGWANSGFDQDTVFYIDDVQVYGVDPGWDAPAPDTTPPLRSNGQPNSPLPAGATGATLSLSTDEAATCHLSPAAGTTYAAMTYAFSGAGTTSHSYVIPQGSLANGQSYTLYVRCNDSAGNVNTNDYIIQFSVANAVSACGNGVVDGGEQCDTGAALGSCPATCSLSCTTNSCGVCGDGFVNTGEQCDTGAQRGTCPATCSASCTNNNCEGASPLFEDNFDSYTSGTNLAGRGANGFAWGAPTYTRVSNDIANSGSNSIKFSYGPFEPNGDTHWWSEQPFQYPITTELWTEYYVYFLDGTEGLGARYYHNYPNSANNLKFFAFWADQYQGIPLGTFQLWSTGNATGDSVINLARTDSTLGGPIRYAGGSYPFITGDADRGRWIQVRIHMRVADVGQSNGVFQLWKDGQLFTNLTTDPYYDLAGVTNYFRNAYLMGYDNNHFLEDTNIYIDDFKFYDEDPGWT